MLEQQAEHAQRLLLEFQPDSTPPQLGLPGMELKNSESQEAWFTLRRHWA
jgi:hypothetical protein